MSKFVEHRSPNSNNAKAKAPYNFVSLPEKILLAEGFERNDKYQAERHTGYITLKITNETPLYTRCAFPPSVWSNPNNFDDKGKLKIPAVRDCQDFFHHGNKAVPVIPGSTLRGVTRALVEILAYAKMNFVTDSQLVHRAIADIGTLGDKYRKQLLGEDKGTKHYDYPSPNLKGGYLEERDNNYFIRPAIENNNESFVHIEIDDLDSLGVLADNIVYVDKSTTRMTEANHGEHNDITLDLARAKNISATPQANFLPAKLVKTKIIGRKHMHSVIFEADPDDSKLIPISDETWRIYKEDRDMQRGIQPLHKIKNHGDALFYLLDDRANLVFFGSTMMFRLPYMKTVENFIPEILRCLNHLDYAETIFGTVESLRKNPKFDGRQLAGRVFFSDAICTTPNPFFQNNKQGRFVPKILSSPKPTSFQLYLAQPTPNHKNDLKSYYDADETVIRGSKRYWHKTALAEDQEAFADQQQQAHINNLTSKQHTIIKPVKKGAEFVGKVYFENLLEEELGALLTALELSANGSSKRHQIGMGKPYGLGSVKVETGLVLHNRENRYATLFDEQNTIFSDGSKSDEETEKIKTNAKQSFKEKVLNHFNDIVQPSSKVSDFWEIPRLQALATMMEWETANNFHRKEYANLQDDKMMWTRRFVLPHPQNVENNVEPPQIKLINPNLWSEQCSDSLEKDANKNKVVENMQNVFVQQTLTAPLALLNLPPNKVASELHQHYQDWLNVTDENLKLKIAKVIVEKGTHWSNAKKKDWYNKVIEFVEKNK